MNSERTRSTNNTSQKKTITFIEILAVVMYILGYVTIALVIIVGTSAMRIGIEFKERKNSKNNSVGLVINVIIFLVVIYLLIRNL